jgi:hypothetical protein
MTNLINAIKSTLRSFEIKSLYKIVLSFLAITLLVTITACNGSEVASKTNLENPPPGKITELYKPITPEVGGMNNYSDVDPRVDTSKIELKVWSEKTQIHWSKSKKNLIAKEFKRELKILLTA